MTKRRGKMVSLTVMVFPDQMENIAEIANQHNISMGEVVRKLIDNAGYGPIKSDAAKTKGEKK